MTLTESRKIKFLFEESNGVLTEGIMDNIKNSIKKRFSRKDTEEIKQSLSDNLGIDENSSVEEIEEKLREETGGKDNFNILKKVLKEVAGFGAMVLTFEIQAMIGAGIIKFFDYSPIAIAAVVIYTIYSLSENWEKIRRKGLGKKVDQFIFGKSSHLGDYNDKNKKDEEMNESRKNIMNRLTERDLSRIVRQVIKEDKEDKKTMNDIPDSFFKSFLSKTSSIMTSEEFSDIEDILGKRVGSNGQGMGDVFEKIFMEARTRRRRD